MLSWASRLGGLLSGVGGIVIKLTLTLLTLFFFYKDGDAIVSQSRQVINVFFDDRLDAYVVTAGKMTRAVVYGLLITALTQGLIAGVGYWVVGLTAPVLLGALTAVLSVVPLVGTAIVWVPAAIWLLSSGQVLKGVILLAWGLLLVYPADGAAADPHQQHHAHAVFCWLCSVHSAASTPSAWWDCLSARSCLRLRWRSGANGVLVAARRSDAPHPARGHALCRPRRPR